MSNFYEVTPNASLDEIREAVLDVVDWINGGAAAGAPFFGHRWDGLADDGSLSTDYAYNWDVGEPTLSQLFRFRDVNKDILLQGDINGLYGMRPLHLGGTLHVEGATTLDDDLIVDTTLFVVDAGDHTVSIDTDLFVADADDNTVSIDTDLFVADADANTVAIDTDLLVVDADANTVAIDTDLLVADADANTVAIDTDLLVADADADTVAIGTDLLVVDVAAETVTVDTDFLVVDVGNDLITVDTDLLAIDRSARTIAVGATPAMFIEEGTGFIGIGTATPLTPLDMLAPGPLRVGGTGTPSAGEGLELHYDPVTDTANIIPFDRAGAAFGTLNINALDLRLMESSAITYQITNLGAASAHAWFAAPPVVQQAITGVLSGSPTLAQLTTVVRSIVTGLCDTKYNLFLDSTT